ncbi:MAG: hypothetical protein H6737_30015 [Alphaproteobacteria bacterium]|nr:hypothetical protein [Alphaproteobacteria bacterium]
MQVFALTPEGILGWAQRKNVRLLENKELGQLALQRPGDPQQNLRFIPRPDRNLMTFALPLLFTVPEDRIPAFCVALSLANSATFAGCWTLNHQRGEPYFRLTVPSAGTGWTDTALDFTVGLMFSSGDRVGPNLMKIALEGADPATVLDPPK